MEGTAGAVPAVLEDLGHELHAGAVHPGFEGLLHLDAQAAGGRQAHPLDALEVDDLPAAVDIAQGDVHAGDGLLGDEDGIVHAEALAGLCGKVTVLELVLTEDDAVHALALEVDLQCRQGHAGNVLKGQTDRVFAADFALEQLHADELHRAARGVIIGPCPRDRFKIFLHNTLPFLLVYWLASPSSGVSGAGASCGAASTASAGSAGSAASAVSACSTGWTAG